MKKVILVGLVLALALSVVPAMAENNSAANDNGPAAFQAMSNLSTIAPMTDTQLAAIEGTAVNVNVQVAVVPQINVCAGVNPSCFVQINAAVVIQKIFGR